MIIKNFLNRKFPTIWSITSQSPPHISCTHGSPIHFHLPATKTIVAAMSSRYGASPLPPATSQYTFDAISVVPRRYPASLINTYAKLTSDIRWSKKDK
jgi:hypothetical protein